MCSFINTSYRYVHSILMNTYWQNYFALFAPLQYPYSAFMHVMTDTKYATPHWTCHSKAGHFPIDNYKYILRLTIGLFGIILTSGQTICRFFAVLVTVCKSVLHRWFCHWSMCLQINVSRLEISIQFHQYIP